MSRITAPVGEVMTPITPGRIRDELLARLVEQALGGELLLALFEQRHQRADAGRLQALDDDLVGRAARIGGEPPGGDHLEAFLGLEADTRRRRRCQITASILAPSSFRAK